MGALVLQDRVKETCSSSGTTTFNLAGAVSDFQSFVAGIGTGNDTFYSAADGVTGWEVGRGTVTSGSPNILSRNTIYSSSNAGSKVNFSTSPLIAGITPAILVQSLINGTSGSVYTSSASGIPIWLAPGVSGNVLVSNGTVFTSAPLAASNLSNGVSGTGQVVLGSAITPFAGANKIINGDMRIDQRNSGGIVLNPTTSVADYTVDRWYIVSSEASKIQAQQNAGSVGLPPGASNYLGITSTSSYSVSSTDYFLLRQIIEGVNIADLNWGTANAKTATLSFLAYSSVSGIFGGALQNGAQNQNYPFAYSIPVANTWENISVTIPGPSGGVWSSNTSGGIIITLGLGVGSTYSLASGTWTSGLAFSSSGAVGIVATSGAVFNITNAKFEIGSFNTPFIPDDYAVSLQKCKRYYQRYGGETSDDSLGVAMLYSSTQAEVPTPGFTQMRTIPSLVTNASGAFFMFYNGAGFGCNISLSSYCTSRVGQITGLTNSSSWTGGGCGLLFPNASSDWFAYSAEL